MATGASYITAEYSFTALGDGINSIMNMGGEEIDLSNGTSSSSDVSAEG
jgi:hypothetical protein